VMHLALDTREANGTRKFGEEGVNQSTTTDDFDTGHLKTGGLVRGRQRCDSVQQVVVPTVHQEAEMGEEVSPMTDCDIGHHEPPSWCNPRLRLRGSQGGDGAGFCLVQYCLHFHNCK
jgi:hypothetical protein